MGIDEACLSLISQLACEQDGEGHVPVWIGKNLGDASLRRPARSGFFDAVVLGCLTSVKAYPELEGIRRRLADALESQLSRHGAVNYWLRNSPEAAAHPYPDDLDSTSCAIGALSYLRPARMDGERLGKFALLLTVIEERPGGPYRTWIVGPDAEMAWRDIDLAVNANIAGALHAHKVRVAGLDAFLSARITAGEYASPYYPSPIPVGYFLSRAGLLASQSKIVDDLFALRRPDASFGDVLQTSLAVSALLYCQIPVARLEPTIRYLLEQVEAVGCGAESFCIDSMVEGVTYLAGSSMLTAAACLEALSLYAAAQSSVYVVAVPVRRSLQEEQIMAGVLQALEDRTSRLAPELRERFNEARDAVVGHARGDEAPLLPWRFHAALRPDLQIQSDIQLVDLGFANALGWMAYTVYDDFLDGEGDPKLLPVANLCLRELVISFQAPHVSAETFLHYFNEVMDLIDGANAWEVTHCRLLRTEHGFQLPEAFPVDPGSMRLAERSLGHALGPMAILAACGYPPSSHEAQQLEVFFRHYLIARQLDDDAHDWSEDLAKGQVNSAGVLLLSAWRAADVSRVAFSPADLPELQRIFWDETIVVVARQMQEHVASARVALGTITVLADTSSLSRLLDPIERSATRVLHERQETLAFLEVFR